MANCNIPVVESISDKCRKSTRTSDWLYKVTVNRLASPSKIVSADCGTEIDFRITSGCFPTTVATKLDGLGGCAVIGLWSCEGSEAEDSGRSLGRTEAARPICLTLGSPLFFQG